MSDLVKQLRLYQQYGYNPADSTTLDKAADRIERLEAFIVRNGHGMSPEDGCGESYYCRYGQYDRTMDMDGTPGTDETCVCGYNDLALAALDKETK